MWSVITISYHTTWNFSFSNIKSIFLWWEKFVCRSNVKAFWFYKLLTLKHDTDVFLGLVSQQYVAPLTCSSSSYFQISSLTWEPWSSNLFVALPLFLHVHTTVTTQAHFFYFTDVLHLYQNIWCTHENATNYLNFSVKENPIIHYFLT